MVGGLLRRMPPGDSDYTSDDYYPTSSSPSSSSPSSYPPKSSSTTSPPPPPWSYQTHTSTSSSSSLASPSSTVHRPPNPPPSPPIPYTHIIIPPIILFSVIAAVLFFFYRNRRRRARQHQQQRHDDGAPPPVEEIREYRSDLPPPTIDVPRPLPPIILSSTNNAYLTGLDTPSRGTSIRSSQDGIDYPPARRSLGGTTFAEPPPPYKADGSIHSREDPPIAYSEIDPAVSAAGWSRSPFEDPEEEEEEIGVADGMMYGEMQRRVNPFDDPDSDDEDGRMAPHRSHVSN